MPADATTFSTRSATWRPFSVLALNLNFFRSKSLISSPVFLPLLELAATYWSAKSHVPAATSFSFSAAGEVRCEPLRSDAGAVPVVGDSVGAGSVGGAVVGKRVGGPGGTTTPWASARFWAAAAAVALILLARFASLAGLYKSRRCCAVQPGVACWSKFQALGSRPDLAFFAGRCFTSVEAEMPAARSYLSSISLMAFSATTRAAATDAVPRASSSEAKVMSVRPVTERMVSCMIASVFAVASPRTLASSWSFSFAISSQLSRSAISLAALYERAASIVCSSEYTLNASMTACGVSLNSVSSSFFALLWSSIFKFFFVRPALM
mmetsp:Transcript_25508/g.87963  ORF Transcript_25508/g.87963 Transcript_25508/m.87963 type:complete len:323 (-) Transcript_25508:965-1933(-)